MTRGERALVDTPARRSNLPLGGCNLENLRQLVGERVPINFKKYKKFDFSAPPRTGSTRIQTH